MREMVDVLSEDILFVDRDCTKRLLGSISLSWSTKMLLKCVRVYEEDTLMKCIKVVFKILFGDFLLIDAPQQSCRSVEVVNDQDIQNNQYYTTHLQEDI